MSKTTSRVQIEYKACAGSNVGVAAKERYFDTGKERKKNKTLWPSSKLQSRLKAPLGGQPLLQAPQAVGRGTAQGCLPPQNLLLSCQLCAQGMVQRAHGQEG